MKKYLFDVVASANNSDSWGEKFVVIITAVIKEYVDIIQTPLAQLTILKALEFLGLSFVFLMVVGVLIALWSLCFGHSDSDY